MDTGRNDLLGEIAADAALERGDFLVQATEQLRRFLDRHKERIAAYGGLTLIDEEPDYLAIAPDGTFRSRTRFLDDLTGDWVSETEVIETASELVELYNPADVYAAFSEAAKEAAGLSEEPTATDDILDAAGIAPEETMSLGDDPYAAAADSWAAGQPADVELDDDDAAARRLYDLALEYQERSQRAESRLLDDFEQAAGPASNLLGELVIVDDDDERLVLTSAGEFRAEVVPEDAEGEWRSLTGPEQLVEFYDPTDVFGDLADALAEAYPAVAPELADAKDAGGGDAAVADIDADDAEDDDAEAHDAEDDDDAEARDAEDDEEGGGAEGRPTA
ncbi:MAG TPA: hypothetical protein VFN41_01875 [Candidatus Limnocylindrales bacterium]|nr:hypothetical protein [Candidatus Limnocylindrales bacterium]